ncbi:putative uncharacterized protein YghO [Alteripontixanthobacter maritimus]|uniref:N-acetyltransferase domain-containing protein n=1 Tax=Alteripontixanthobacter maritimus TaxID=2161824 RepID=A0A369QAE3_9SPHN|nr:N-acetyltransferase [Alteripontixanthobacter maritimus]RDC60515.1 putative uncharacterized protein YghO [Alteripontixanthobacter maritimus]
MVGPTSPSSESITIAALDAADRKDRARFVDLGRRFAATIPNYVPQLRGEQLELLDPSRNPFFAHARVQLFVAVCEGRDVGRITAHIDELALQVPREQGFGPGTGMFGYFDAETQDVADLLLETAADWLRAQEMERMLGPISLSIWEEPGLLVQGQEHAPMLMMGHHPAHYRDWVEKAGLVKIKSLRTYNLNITKPWAPVVQRIVKSGHRNDRIVMRRVSKSDWPNEVRIVLNILNDAWSGNWGFVPFTDAEIDYAAKKMKPIIFSELNRIVELDGEPIAFMMVLPDINDMLAKIGGRLFPFGWIRLLRWLRKPRDCGVRVPLMGVLREHHASRLASQVAFMMIDDIRTSAVEEFGSTRGEIGWILDDNKGMIAIADMLETKLNRDYWIFEKAL